MIEFSEAELAEYDEQIRLDAIDEFVKIFEEIDSCEFAMFSLCLIKENAERLKGKNGQT